MKNKKKVLLLSIVFLMILFGSMNLSKAQEIKTKIYTCIEDSYVSEENINENYGYSGLLYAGMYQYFDGEYHHDVCISFLKFDIMERPYKLDNIKEIYLEIYSNNMWSYGTPFILSAFTVSSNWDENTITYINSPIYDTYIHSVDIIDQAILYQFNFTSSAWSSSLFDEFGQTDSISFYFRIEGTITADMLFTFASREWHSGVLASKLYVEYEVEEEESKKIFGFMMHILIGISCLSVVVIVYKIRNK